MFAPMMLTDRRLAEVIRQGLHITDEGWCWCQPRQEDVMPYGYLTIHRHFWDRPEYGEDE